MIGGFVGRMGHLLTGFFFFRTRLGSMDKVQLHIADGQAFEPHFLHGWSIFDMAVGKQNPLRDDAPDVAP